MAGMVQVMRSWIDRQFAPRHEVRFLLRIRLRILKLRLALWWRTPKAAVLRQHWPKPVALIAIGVIVPILTGWLLAILFPAEARGVGFAVRNLLTGTGASSLGWREAAQLLFVLVGIPSAFLLWLFRDLNVSGTLENQRKDVNLKEFQEIQMRAAGALNESLPAAARETLQIAALHQLRAFLRGEYGNSFRRPALELLRARFVASAQSTGTQAIRDWLNGWRREARAAGDRRDDINLMKRNVRSALASLRENRVAETERLIVMEEWQAIFRSGMPIVQTVFDRVILDEPLLADLDLRQCRFIGAFLAHAHLELAELFQVDFALADLSHGHFEAADLGFAHLEGAILKHAHLQHANLFSAHFEGADLRWAALDGATLTYAYLESANLAGASLDGADLSYARLQGANLAGISVDAPNEIRGAILDADTQLWFFWSELPESEQEAYRETWLARGAVRGR
jgi:uncharacterized protein YjbI with pentapeptide repeats